MRDEQHTKPTPLPTITDRASWQTEVDTLRRREKAHTKEGDAIAAARRRLPMVELDPSLPVQGAHGPVPLLEVFEGRQQLIAYYHMWHVDAPAADQCMGCTYFNGQVRERSSLLAKGITYATFCFGPYESSIRYRDFMGWDMPWYSIQDHAEPLLAGREFNGHLLVCYLRSGDRVFETYYTTGRGVEAMDYTYALMDLTAYGRMEAGEDSPAGWPQYWPVDGSEMCVNDRPTAQWPRLRAGHSDDLNGSDDLTGSGATPV